GWWGGERLDGPPQPPQPPPLNICIIPPSTLRSAMPQAEPVAAVPTDAALIAAWQGGDEQAAAELVRRHARALARFLASAGEAEGRLLEGLRRLPRMQREVFLLRAQQGFEYEEIAAALGTSPGAARVHYHHAVKRLKEHLQ